MPSLRRHRQGTRLDGDRGRECYAVRAKSDVSEQGQRAMTNCGIEWNRDSGIFWTTNSILDGIIAASRREILRHFDRLLSCVVGGLHRQVRCRW